VRALHLAVEDAAPGEVRQDMSDYRNRRHWDELRRRIRGRDARDGEPLFSETDGGRHVTISDALEIAFILLIIFVLLSIANM
jgi:hypothetical protein